MDQCEPGADPVIQKYFYDCVYNVRDYIGFSLGLAAIGFWLFAQVPQFVSNYKNKSAEALSPWFLAQWLLGDTTNLLGCLLQGLQLPTTTYTAMYFVIVDVFMMVQYIYYGALQRRRERILQLQARRIRHQRRRHHHGDNRSRAAVMPGQQQQHGADMHSSSTLPAGSREHYQRSLKHHSRPHQQQQQQQWQWQQQQWQCHHNRQVGSSDSVLMEYGSDSSCGVADLQWQRQEAQQQMDPSIAVLSVQHLSEATSRQQRQPGGSCCSSTGQALPVSCSAAAGKHCQTGTVFSFGLPAVAVSLLVSLGLVAVLVPANTSWGLMAQGPWAAAHRRAIQAGSVPHNGLHAAHITASSREHSPIGADSSGSGSNGSSMVGSSSSSLSADSIYVRVEPDPRQSWGFLIGTGFGYCSSVLYLSSRFSQIHKNYCRKSSEGLALAMFIMAVCANFCTGSGILFRTFSWQELKEQLPWVIGTYGTISLDMVILCQSLKYSNKAATAADGAAGAQERHFHVIPLEQQQQQAVANGDAHRATSAALYYSARAAARSAARPAEYRSVTAGAHATAILSSSVPNMSATAAWQGLSHCQAACDNNSARTQLGAAAGASDSDSDVPEVTTPLLPVSRYTDASV